MRRLTTEEIDKVRAKQKPTGQRPRYYSLATGTTVEISRDFEAFLILAAPAVKTQAIGWINTIADLIPDRENWQELLGEAIAQSVENGDTLEDAVNTSYEGFNAFREQLNITGFEDIAELGLLLEDLKIGLGNLGERARETKHLQVISNILDIRSSSDYSDSRLDQLRSWIPVLTTY